MSTELMSRFLEGLHDSRLLDNERIDELLRRPEPAQGDLDGTSRFLQERGWLTPYQIEEIQHGRGRGLIFNGIRIVAKLGTEEWGICYQAIHPGLGAISLRLIPLSQVEAVERVPDYVARLRHLSLVNHPQLVNLLDAGESDGHVFIISEFFDGTDLGSLVRDMGPVPLSLACDYVRQAAQGVQVLHERGLIHGNFAPNCMNLSPVIRKQVTRDGSNRIAIRPAPNSQIRVDGSGFALRRPLAEGGNGVGWSSPDFLPPELLVLPQGSLRGDVYGLGAALYFLLTGRSPFNRKTPAETIQSLQTSEIPWIASLRSDITSDAARVIHHMLARDPDRRPANAAEVVTALTSFSSMPRTVPTTARPSVPVASETMSLPKMAAGGVVYADPVDPPPPLAEALPGVEPLHDHHDHHRQEESHHDDPWGSHHHESADDRPREVVKKSSMSSGMAVLLVTIGIVINLICVLFWLWYAEKWPFSPSEVTEPEPKQNQHKTKPNPKRTSEGPAVEWWERVV